MHIRQLHFFTLLTPQEKEKEKKKKGKGHHHNFSIGCPVSEYSETLDETPLLSPFSFPVAISLWFLQASHQRIKPSITQIGITLVFTIQGFATWL